MKDNTIYSREDIEKIYLQWMNESENGSFRKDRFISLLKSIPLETQYEIEQWLVSSLAIGLQEGYNKALEEKRNE
jgi:hypothetical protein